MGQVKLGQAKLGKFKSGQVKSGLNKSCKVWVGHVQPRQVKLIWNISSWDKSIENLIFIYSDAINDNSLFTFWIIIL